MSTNPTQTPPFTLAAEVEYLLQTKDDYLASSRSSAALSVLKTLYEELESSWQELNMPTEELQLQQASLNLLQEKRDWKESYEKSKEKLRQTRARLQYLSHQQTLTLPQLIEELMQKYSGEWKYNAKFIEQQQQLEQQQMSWTIRKKAIEKPLTDAFLTHQRNLKQQEQQRQQSLTELKQTFETNTANTKTLLERKQHLSEKRQSLQKRKQQLAQVLKQRNEHDLSRSELLAKQRTDLQRLTALSSKLESENAPLVEKRNKLAQAGWISENELLPLDLSPILNDIPKLTTDRW